MSLVSVKLDEDDVERLEKLIKRTLLEIISIAKKHVDNSVVSEGEKVNMFRQLTYAILIDYTAALLKSHLRLDTEAVEVLAKEITKLIGDESGIPQAG